MPGAQMTAARSKADVLLLGGGVFGGKSTLVHMLLCRYVLRRNFSGVVFRREATMFKGSGGLWEKSKEFYPGLGGKKREAPMFDWRFEKTGGVLSFSGLEKADDWQKHEGNEYAVIAFDEAHQFERQQILALLQRNRTPIGYDGPTRMILTCNPPRPGEAGYHLIRNELVPWFIDDDGWPIPERAGVLRYFTIESDEIVWVDKDWRDEDGIGPTSFTFVPLLMGDNPIGEAKNPRYRARLRAQTKAEQRRKLQGNWNVEGSASLFEHGWIRWVGRGEFGLADLARQIRYWDQAATPKERATSAHSATASARGCVMLCPVCDGWRFTDGGAGEPCALCNPDGMISRELARQWALDAIAAEGDEDAEAPRRELLIITHVTEDFLGPGGVEALTLTHAKMDGKSVPVYIEQETAASGAGQIHNYQTHVLPGFEVVGDKATGQKVVRAGPIVALAERGLLIVVRGEWDTLVAEALATYTPQGAGKHKDVIDAISGLHAACLRHQWPVEFAWTF